MRYMKEIIEGIIISGSSFLAQAWQKRAASEFEIGEMVPPSAADGVRDPNSRHKFPGFLANAKKNKSSFVQFFIMTGILLTGLRSVGQKYRIYELTEDAVALSQEQESITARMNHIKQSLRTEAAAEPTGAFAARLRLLFGDE